MTDTARAGARRTLAALLDRLRHAPADAAAAYQASEIALDHALEEDAAPAIALATARVGDEPRLWQMLGLVQRGREDTAAAIAAFTRATTLAPGDPRAAHGLALATMEGGLPAAALYEHARRLAPGDGMLTLGHAWALAAQREGVRGLALLADACRAAPGWVAGHEGHARLAATLGLVDRATATVDAALRLRPADIALHAARLAILSRIATPDDRLRAAAEARRLAGDAPVLRVAEATAASESGRIAEADALFLSIGRHQDAGIALAMLRHLIRAQRFDEADRLAGRLAAGPDPVTAWAYRHTAWRATGDPRLRWLEQDGALVRAVPLEGLLPPLDRLAAVLRAIHVGAASPLDQSVRGGTQTEGPLFARLEPEIRALRRILVEAVDRYVEALPPPDPAHPLLSAPRGGGARFAGSWSVRLSGAGHHTNHIHAQGWLSSALHIALPPAEGRSGWFTIGAPPQELGLAMPPAATVAPVAGRLLLFPAWLWHGVTPFAAGERLSIAFDVARPRC